jgi:hypothetical protein
MCCTYSQGYISTVVYPCVQYSKGHPAKCLNFNYKFSIQNMSVNRQKLTFCRMSQPMFFSILSQFPHCGVVRTSAHCVFLGAFFSHASSVRVQYGTVLVPYKRLINFTGVISKKQQELRIKTTTTRVDHGSIYVSSILCF